jgi:hypothetical protein
MQENCKNVQKYKKRRTFLQDGVLLASGQSTTAAYAAHLIHHSRGEWWIR